MGKERNYAGHRQLLRERFLKSGLDPFQDYEAIELLLTLAIPRKDVKPAAKEAIRRFGSFRGVLDATIEELQKVPGMGQVATVAIRIIREAVNRYLQQRSQEMFSINHPEVLFSYCRAEMRPPPHEVFKVIFLDSAYRVLGDKIIAEGTIDRATVYLRNVMEEALKRNAAVLVFAHNHPNGNVTPSEEDKLVTQALVLAAKTLQIEVYDHVIVSRDEVFSLIIALVAFLLVRALVRLQRSKEAPAPMTKECPFCFSKVPLKATRCPHCTSELEVVS